MSKGVFSDFQTTMITIHINNCESRSFFIKKRRRNSDYLNRVSFGSDSLLTFNVFPSTKSFGTRHDVRDKMEFWVNL
jgi:hypothetical protein